MTKHEYEPYMHAHIKATICNLDRLEAEPDHGRQISFPISDDDLQRVLTDVGCTGIPSQDGTCYIKDFECSISGLCDNFEEIQASIEDMNVLAAQIKSMSYNEYWRYEMIVAAQKKFDDPAHGINIALNLDKYSCYAGITNTYDLGDFYSSLQGIEHDDVDAVAYGDSIQKSQNGVFTQLGYVCQEKDWTQFYKREYDRRGVREMLAGVTQEQAQPEPDRSDR